MFIEEYGLHLTEPYSDHICTIHTQNITIILCTKIYEKNDFISRILCAHNFIVQFEEFACVNTIYKCLMNTKQLYAINKNSFTKFVSSKQND